MVDRACWKDDSCSPIKEFPSYHGTGISLTVFKDPAISLKLGAHRPVKSFPKDFLKINFNIIISSTYRSSKLPSSLRFSKQIILCITFPCVLHATSILFYQPNNTWRGAQTSPLLINSPPVLYLVSLRPKHFPSCLILWHTRPLFLL